MKRAYFQFCQHVQTEMSRQQLHGPLWNMQRSLSFLAAAAWHTSMLKRTSDDQSSHVMAERLG